MKKQEREAYEITIRAKWEQVRGALDERARRLWAASEAIAAGYYGVSVVSRATGMARSTIDKGVSEIQAGVVPTDIVRVRRRGGGRKKIEEQHPEVLVELAKLVDPGTRGDPESPLRWTSKGTERLAQELSRRCQVSVCANTVCRLLDKVGFSMQAPTKTTEGKRHPDREEQFEYIQTTADECILHGVPVISVDAKKKELVGDFKNGGREWQPKGRPERTNMHDFPDDAKGKAIPYGVYDIGANCGYVSVGVSHDTGAFAVMTVETWWNLLGSKRYPGAKEIYITADAGGSNGYRLRQWKFELQRFADKYHMQVHVSHFPPGTSKWNKIEHRLFSFITLNWRGRPLRTYETVVNLIGNTTTKKGLVVTAQMDERDYPIGVKVTDAQMRTINIHKKSFHGDWNYMIRPRQEHVI